eukprot:3693738-Pleurochrysis_carterae.AAC.4
MVQNWMQALPVIAPRRTTEAPVIAFGWYAISHGMGPPSALSPAVANTGLCCSLVLAAYATSYSTRIYSDFLCAIGISHAAISFSLPVSAANRNYSSALILEQIVDLSKV